MKRKIVKIISVVLTSISVLTLGSSVFANELTDTTASGVKLNDTEIISSDDTLISDDEVVDIHKDLVRVLDENCIDYYIANNTICLADNGSENVNKVNELLSSSNNSNSRTGRAAKYPSPWYHLKSYDAQTSSKFKKASKAAFADGVKLLVFGRVSNPAAIAAAAAWGFGNYYFQNTHIENVYYFHSHHYRILGPDYFTSNGVALGRYEMKKNIRTTKSPYGVGGQFSVRTQKSTAVIPMF